MSFQSLQKEAAVVSLDDGLYPLPLSSDELVSAEDVDNLHAIISHSHLEDDDEQELKEGLERELHDEDHHAKLRLGEQLDAEYMPYQRQNPNVVVTFSLWDVFRKGAINLVLPFINGVMLGFGEILAHEIGFHYGFFGSRVQPPRRMEKLRNQRFKERSREDILRQ